MERNDKQDGEQWAAVEEATEVVLDGRYEDGLRMLKAVLDADPSNPYAYQFLGATLFELEKFEPARDAYAAAVTISPDYLAARIGLAHAHRLCGDPMGSLQEAEETMRRFPEDGDSMYAAGLALAALGQRQRAILMLERFLATKPELEAQLEARSMVEMLRKSGRSDAVEFE
jgi:tetratricopeptide (TPR) repeat protein